jgi:competence protein ComEA
MKHFSFELLKNWFGYTRRERRSTFILICLIVIVISVRFIVPEQKIRARDFDLSYYDFAMDSVSVVSVGSSQSFNYKNKKSTQPVSLEINTCDSASLEALPGIGPVLAARIIKFRNLLNGYASVDQLKEVYGLSEETYNLISGRLVCDPSHIKKININNAEYKQLKRIPYFKNYEVNSILKFRELQGRIEDLQVLVNNKIITFETAQKVKPYLKFTEQGSEEKTH